MSPSAGDPRTILLWAQVVLVWALANYFVAADPIRENVDGVAVSPPLRNRWLVQVAGRGVTAGIVADILAQGSGWDIGLAIAALCLVQPLLRIRVRPSLIAEMELLVTLVFLAGSFAIIFGRPELARFGPRGSSNRMAAACLIAALFVFVLRGGTYIVRGILDKCGALPPMFTGQSLESDLATRVDFNEFNRGRLIGNLERILLAIMVAGSSYAALGFLVAAKGLIRSKDLEDRSWAEYFLVGTLASVLVAVGVGLCVRLVLRMLW
jgi:hypothetical protein